jgi:demethylmenaquinone methyltransferase/2-methoxy-6-polyprenyl-1,4-benzoquinol methylase
MANEFFDPGAQRATKVRLLFDRIASRYDLINDLQSFGLHRLWKRKVVRLANPQPGDRALDLCCGTGDLASRLQQAGAKVVGLDFSSEMLNHAVRRLSSGNVCFVRGDAQQLPFQNDSFDIVTIGYGLRNLADWEQGLTEMTRVLRPGGRIVALEFGRPDWGIWRSIYFAYLRVFVPVLGLAFCGSAGAYGYILESLKNYPGQAAVAAKMRALGLQDPGNSNILGGAMSITCGKKAVSSSSSLPVAPERTNVRPR